MRLVEGARRRIVGVYLLLGILAAAGVWSVMRLPSSIFPSVTFPLVRVIADVGEEPAARMMPTATRPLEEAILRVPGIQTVRSTTSRGSSEIDAQFHWGTDMQVALQRVQAATQRVQPTLPPETQIDVEWMNPAVFPIEGYALTSKTESLAQLRALAEYTLKPALIRIPGVSQVQIQGGRQRQFEVHLDAQALQGRGLAVGDVASAIRDQNVILSAGLTERNHELYLTLVNGRVHDLSALEQLAVPTPAGPPATLAELGTVKVADEVSYIRTTANGQRAVLVNVIRQPSANTVSIASGVDQLFRDQPDLLPKDVQWTNFYDQAHFVANSVGGTRDAIFIGVLLAALVLLVFLRDWRLTLIAVAAIPLTVAIVGLAMSVFGETINLMTLAGIAAALGLIADDAIVVIENIHRYREEGREDPVSSSVREILPALIGSSLSTTIILLPFALVNGVVGAFFKPLAFTMAATLAVSYGVALVAVPVAVHKHAPPREGKEKQSWWDRAKAFAASHMGGVLDAWRRLVRWSGRTYEAVVRLFVRHALVPALVTVGLIGVAYFLYQNIGTDFLPAMDEGSIIMDYFTPPGTSLAETDAMLRRAERVIIATPGVESYSRRTGTQLGFFITEPNTGDYVIKLKPRSQRAAIQTVMDQLRTRIAAVEPAVNTDFGQLLEDNIGDLSGGTPQPVDVKLFGDNISLLHRRAKQVAAVLGNINGVTDVFNGITISGPSLVVDVNAEAAARYGLTTTDVHAAVAPAVNGAVEDQIRVGQRVYDLRVFAAPPDSLANLPIRGKTPPVLVPLSTLATIHTSTPEAEIDRENLQTYVGVTARLSGRNLGSAMNEIKQKVGSQVQLGPGMSVHYGGLYKQQQQSFQSLLFVLFGGLVLVGVIVLFEFTDWRAPIATALCAIAVLAGVFGALVLTGTTLNISSYVGAIMMVGIVGENAIFVIHEAQRALRDGQAPQDAWVTAAHLRLRPVAMTVLATAFALAPLALAIGQGSQLMQALAIAVIGGFVVSGPIVLLVLPGLYRAMDPHGHLGD